MTAVGVAGREHQPQSRQCRPTGDPAVLLRRGRTAPHRSSEPHRAWGRAGRFVLAGAKACAEAWGFILLSPEKQTMHLCYRKWSFSLLKSSVGKSNFFSSKETTMARVLVHSDESSLLFKYSSNEPSSQLPHSAIIEKRNKTPSQPFGGPAWFAEHLK